MNPLANILLYQEMLEERKELRLLGLTSEEIECYFEFYIDSYLTLEDNQLAKERNNDTAFIL